MRCYDIVLDFVTMLARGLPIFIEEVVDYIKVSYEYSDEKKLYNNVKVILNKMHKKGILEKVYNGIYYRPVENIFGKMAIGNKEIIKYKYISDKKGNIKGYVTGAKLFNDAHLTTQVPNVIDITTNECKNYNKYNIDKLKVVIRKPKILIDNDNYKYLQLFDLIENKDHIKIEVDNVDDLLYMFIKNNNLDFEKIIKYAMVTKSRNVINKILTLAR